MAEDVARIEELIGRMTLEEKVSLCAGWDAWHTTAVPRLSIPQVKVTDGPNGARGGTFENTSACFPCGTALGATWDPELVREIGAALGQEAKTKGCQVLLAPTLNIHRHPLAGRNFECPSEDPYLASRIVEGYVTGVQSEGVAATLKHFVCNDSEHEWMTISSEVGERALREIYLPAFEAGVKAGAWAVMTAYNRINGTYACDHAELVDGILKGEWGFDGLVMSDWWGTQSTEAAANAGLDLEMPGKPRHFGKRLLAAVDAGNVSEGVVEEKVRRLLRLAVRTDALEGPEPGPEQSVDRPEHRALIRRAGAAAMVLLRNEGGLLPLDPSRPLRLAVIGPNAATLSVQGGGSARVEPHHVVSPLEAIQATAGPGVDVRYEVGCRINRTTPVMERGLESVGEPGAKVEFFDNPDLAGEPASTRTARNLRFQWMVGTHPAGTTGPFSMRVSAKFTAAETGRHRLTLISAGLSRLLLDGELLMDNWTQQTPGRSFFGGGSAEVGGEVELAAGEPHDLVVEYQSPSGAGVFGLVVGCRPPEDPSRLERAVELARTSDVAVVVAGLNQDWESEGHDRTSLDLPGEQNELIRRVAEANPKTVVVLNAGSPVAMPWANQVASILEAWYPGQEGGDAIADVLFGISEPGGRLPTTFTERVEDHPSHRTYPGENGRVEYDEGIFVGYRAFDRGPAPLFPFGHGLSYTTFEYGSVSLDSWSFQEGETLTATVSVRNRGKRAGSEVVQFYVRDVESTIERPEKELKGFAKVELRPGEERDVSVTLDQRAFAAWHPGRGWVAEAGAFEVLVGRSAGDIRSRAECRLVE